ncbi:tyrosine-type recombinase/integrase [Psychrobacillus sp. L4]|uniref:tyrosine-type recombinase/integrase n=1 Tax=Psychrobacillus sp. L4 TaxID=3236892 RepID=UPI0036F23165
MPVKDKLIKEECIKKRLNDAENSQIIKACTTPLEKSLVAFILSTGCRFGEIALLEKSDINWEDRTVRRRWKVIKEQDIYFNNKCRTLLRSFIVERKDLE